MTQPASPKSVVGDFSPQTMSWMGRTYRTERRGDEFFVELIDPDWEWDRMSGRRTQLQPGASPPRVWRKVMMTTGSHHQQVYWVAGAKARQLDYFPFLWLIDEKRWIPRREAFLKHPEIVEGLTLWNYTCIECHSTAGIPGGSRETNWHTWDSKAAELGIACEACHGPGAAHVKAHQNPLHRYGERLADQADPTIFNPARASHEDSSHACGQCHGIAVFPNLHRFYERGVDFKPGHDLSAKKAIVFPSRASCQGLVEVASRKDKAFEADSYWSDGMVRVSGREFNGMAESPCYKAGEMSCLSCHSMHDAAPHDQLARRMETNSACTQCHESIGKDVSAHTHHGTESSGSLCYNCHMPHTTYGLLQAMRSHQIDAPDVSAEVATGRPNACNLCHLDKTIGWTDGKMQEWFGSKPAKLDADQKNIAAGLLWALRGGPGERALAAWSFGWKPAQEASGTDWMPTALAELLVDEYSAVRFIAGRSFRSIPGGPADTFDFLAPKGQQQKVRAGVVQRFLASPAAKQLAGKGRFLIGGQGDPAAMERNRLRAMRPTRKVNLRE